MGFDDFGWYFCDLALILFDSGWNFNDLVLILLTCFGWVLVNAVDCGDLGWEFGDFGLDFADFDLDFGD